MLADLVVETFVRTDAAGSRRGVRTRWQGAPDLEVVVRWQYRADPAPWGPWTQSDAIRADRFEVFPAAPGRYEFHVFDQAPGRATFDNGFFEIAVGPLLESELELELPKPSGVELVGPSGELLGSPATITARDLRVRWNAVRFDALQTDGLGEAPADELLDFLEVRVVGPAADVLRTALVPVNVTEWTYSYAHNAEDQPLTIDPGSAVRDVRLELRWKDQLGRFGPPAVLEVTQTLQLSGTGDLDPSAATAVTEVLDATEDDDFTHPTVDTYVQMAEVSVVGQGYPVSVTYTDRVEWTLYLSSEPNVDAYHRMEARLRVLDPLNVVVASAVHRWFTQWPNWGPIFDTFYQQPRISLDVPLTLGTTYRLQVHYVWHSENTSRLGGAKSFERRFRITSLKR